MTAGYESFFGLAERPFSLTSDPRYFFKSRSHGRALDALTTGFQSRERFLLVTGDLGVGKTVLCRALMQQLRGLWAVAYIGNPLTTVESCERVLAADFGASDVDAIDAMTAAAVIIIDEAHTLPPPVLDYLVRLSRRQFESEYVFRFALVGQSAAADATRLGLAEIDDRASTKIRLLPLSRDECTLYVNHRLMVAGSRHTAQFSPRGHEFIFGLSGGIPRLINLICERALQEAAHLGAHTIEPPILDTAARALQLLRARSRRFRWYGRRSS